MPTPDTVRMLDDKYAFSQAASRLGLPVPEHHRVDDPAQLGAFDFAGHPGPFVLKSIPYDPVHRLDLTPLPRPTAGRDGGLRRRPPDSDPTRPGSSRAASTAGSSARTARSATGRVQLHCCCPSSAFQVNYAAVEKPAIARWVETFVAAHGITGQVAFDFIETADGTPYAIECNPRTHSAITLFHDHPDVARAYLEDGVPAVRPRPGARPTYWLYHELWRLLTAPAKRRTLRTILCGKDAIFAWSDPLPFLMVHHVQIPLLLLASLRTGKPWVRIDFNIGKLVEPAGRLTRCCGPCT